MALPHHDADASPYPAFLTATCNQLTGSLPARLLALGAAGWGKLSLPRNLLWSPGLLSSWRTCWRPMPIWSAPGSCPIIMTRPSFNWYRTSSTRTPAKGPSASTPLTLSCLTTPGHVLGHPLGQQGYPGGNGVLTVAYLTGCHSGARPQLCGD